MIQQNPRVSSANEDETVLWLFSCQFTYFNSILEQALLLQSYKNVFVAIINSVKTAGFSMFTLHSLIIVKRRFDAT